MSQKNTAVKTETATPAELFITKKPVVKRTGDRAISIKQLLAKKYNDVDLGEYTKVIGQIEAKCLIVIYGPSASGKSVFVLKLANYLAGRYGKVCYNSHEERHNKTIQTRVIDHIVPLGYAEKLYIAPAWDFELLKKKMKSNKYKVVIIDSAQYMGLTYDQVIDLRETFKKNSLLLIIVSFGKGLGATDGCNDILHAADVKININQGKLTSQSRYLSEPYKQILFTPKKGFEPEV